ncbi:hypothetical protein B2J96_05895 [Mycobacterium shigaense]|nr:hypothetical protein B2J96_05895 [Mycobacterium shigaense]
MASPAGLPCRPLGHVGRRRRCRRATLGPLDSLVNNAGMSPVAPSLLETSETLFDKVIGINLKGPTRLTTLAATAMARTGGGSIANISSPCAPADILRPIALNRVGRPEEAFGAVIYPFSDASSYTTGSLLTIDGGLAV